jgi:hypothetical protein
VPFPKAAPSRTRLRLTRSAGMSLAAVLLAGCAQNVVNYEGPTQIQGPEGAFAFSLTADAGPVNDVRVLVNVQAPSSPGFACFLGPDGRIVYRGGFGTCEVQGSTEDQWMPPPQGGPTQPRSRFWRQHRRRLRALAPPQHRRQRRCPFLRARHHQSPRVPPAHQRLPHPRLWHPRARHPRLLRPAHRQWCGIPAPRSQARCRRPMAAGSSRRQPGRPLQEMAPSPTPSAHPTPPTAIFGLTESW